MPLATPTNVSLARYGTNGVTVSWAQGSGLTPDAYVVLYAAGAAPAKGGASVISNSVGAATTVDITGLSIDETYHFGVFSTGAGVESALSATRQVTLSDIVPPAAPAGALAAGDTHETVRRRARAALESIASAEVDPSGS